AAVRLRSVRVRLENGFVSDTVDIHHPVAVEMQYDVLSPGYTLVPSYQFFNRQGTCLFNSRNPKLATRAAAVGRYTSTCWIPGDLLAEGTVTATAVISEADTDTVHVYAYESVAFEVADTRATAIHSDRPGAAYVGAVRPLLDWTTDVAPLPSVA